MSPGDLAIVVGLGSYVVGCLVMLALYAILSTLGYD